tara:strand:+ start:406 stop:1023 length:618 start_codon:yes stop_codon:yes gene_type:complete
MGLFPYDCPICGGGEERCGTTHDDYDSDYCCSGGQCCWENDVIFKEFGSNCYELGYYSGYGYLNKDNEEIQSNTFKDYFSSWQITWRDKIAENFMCKSCFMESVYPYRRTKALKYKKDITKLVSNNLIGNDNKIINVIFSFLNFDPMFDNPFDTTKKYNYKINFYCDYCDEYKIGFYKSKTNYECCDKCEEDMEFVEYVKCKENI